MGAELVVTAVLLVQSIRSDEWQPYDTLRHQMMFENLQACERAKQEMGDEIAVFVARALEGYILSEGHSKIDEYSRVTTSVACQRLPS